MNGYNPLLDYQRNQLMAQQAMIQSQLNQMNMQYQPPQNPLQTQYFAKEVSGFEETKRIVPNPSEIYIFIDGTSGKIYLKQMNSENGRSEYISYSMDKVERAKDPIEQINERLIRIEEKIGGRYEPVSANADGAESGGRDKRNAQEPVGADEGAESAGIQPGTADDKRKK